MNTKFSLDSSAVVSEPNSIVCHGGRGFETKKTLQIVPDLGTSRQVSGDGTVPYASMRFCKLWEREGLDVDIVELEGAEHREILADKRLHDLIVQYVSTKPASLLQIVVENLNINLRSENIKPNNEIFVVVSSNKKTVETNRVVIAVEEVNAAFNSQSNCSLKIGFNANETWEKQADLRINFKICLKQILTTTVAEVSTSLKDLMSNAAGGYITSLKLQPSGELRVRVSTSSNENVLVA